MAGAAMFIIGATTRCRKFAPQGAILYRIDLQSDSWRCPEILGQAR